MAAIGLYEPNQPRIGMPPACFLLIAHRWIPPDAASSANKINMISLIHVVPMKSCVGAAGPPFSNGQEPPLFLYSLTAAPRTVCNARLQTIVAGDFFTVLRRADILL